MRRVALVTLALLGILPGAAHAGTVTTSVSRDCAGDEQDPACYVLHEVRFVAGAGEANDVSVERTADAVIVRDAGVAPAAGAGCSADGANAVRCPFDPQPEPGRELQGTITVRTGDGDDRIATTIAPGARVDNVVLEGGEGNDRITGAQAAPVPLAQGGGLGVWLDGGPGADELLGGPAKELFFGGPDADVIRAGAGDDFVDGDDWLGTPTAGPPAPAPDIVDGGEGRDEIGYDKRSAPIRVDLSDPGPDGEAGEGDRLSGIEDVRGSSGPNVLIGDDGPNRLQGTSALTVSDRLEGRGGDDELIAYGADPDVVLGGPGNDVLGLGARSLCGPGADTVLMVGQGHRLHSDCERAWLLGLVVDVRPVRVGRRRTVLRMRADVEGGGTFSGRVELRSLGRVIGRRRVSLRKGQVREITIRTRRRPAPGTVVVAWSGTDRAAALGVKLRRR